MLPTCTFPWTGYGHSGGDGDLRGWQKARDSGVITKKSAVKVSTLLLATATALSTVAACGQSAQTTPPADESPAASTPATQSPSESPTEAPSESPTEAPTATTPADNPITTTSGVIPGAIVNDGLGEYQQITLADDSFVLQYDETLVTGEATLQSFTPEEILEAQRVVMRFIVEESLDSTLLCNSTQATRSAWLTEHGDFFAPEQAELLAQDALAPQGGLVQKSTDKDDQQWRGDCIYNGGPRITSVELGPQSIYRTEDGDLGFHVAGRMGRNVTAPGTRGQEGTPIYLENTTFDLKLGVEKSADTGAWLLTGSDTEFNTNTEEAPTG